MNFNVADNITVKLPSADGVQQVEVRFPNDAEWIEYRRHKKHGQTDLGRGHWAADSITADKWDLELANKLLINHNGATPALDEAAAFLLLSRLFATEIRDEPELIGNNYHFRLRIFKVIPTAHVMRMPTPREMINYTRQSSNTVFGPYNRSITTVNYQAAGEFYNQLFVSADGYAGELPASIPVCHKAAIVAVLRQETEEFSVGVELPEI